MEDLPKGNEFDNSVISRITNQGIKVNITKDINNLNVSSGNFFFKNEDDKSDSQILSNGKKYKIKGNNNISRKESGFSFLDISIHKHINTNEIGNDINEINDEEDFDKDDNENEDEDVNNKNLDMVNDIYDENEIDEDNEKDNLHNNINNNMNIKNVKKNLNNDLYTKIEGEDKIIEVVSSVVTNEELKNISDDEDEKKEDKKGYLINDSFGFVAPPEKMNEELSFRKDGNK